MTEEELMDRCGFGSKEVKDFKSGLKLIRKKGNACLICLSPEIQQKVIKALTEEQKPSGPDM